MNFICAILLGCCLPIVVAGQSIAAEPSTSPARLTQPTSRPSPKPPSYPTNVGGQPGTGAAMGRPICQRSPQAPRLTALVVPSMLSDQGPLKAIVTTRQPKLWVYVPYHSREIAAATLEVQFLGEITKTDPAVSPVRQENVRLLLRSAQLPGLVGLPVPLGSSVGSGAGPLSGTYQVKLAMEVFCGTQDREKALVQATWDWQSPNLLPTTTVSSSKDQLVEWYLEQGLWYGALDAYLASPKVQQRRDLWLRLLRAVKLETLAPLTTSP